MCKCKRFELQKNIKNLCRNTVTYLLFLLLMVKYIGVETIFLYIVTTDLLTRIKKYNLVGMIIDIN